MISQGIDDKRITIIEDDVWIGQNVIFTPGRIVKEGSIIAAGCVLSNDFPEYSIIGGNPSKLIRSRR
jgi:maltose O-acetyltransferase